MRNFLIVFANVYKEVIRTRSYWYITIALIALSFFIFAAPVIMNKFFDASDNNKFTLVNGTSLQIKSSELEKSTGEKWDIVTESSLADLKGDVKEEKLQGAYILKRNENTLYLEGYYLKENPQITMMLENIIEQKNVQNIIQTKNIDADLAIQLSTPIQNKSVPIYNSEPNAVLIIYGLIAIMYMAISVYGNNVATAIASEKSSRVMEVMITKVPPVPMMYGKILGIGLASLTQLFIFLGSLIIWAKIGIFEVKDNSATQLIVNMLSFETVTSILVLFILGYFIYATMFAVIGAMVSRPDDISSASMPIIIVLMGSLIVEMFLVMDYPEGTVAQVTSYIPFTAPMSVLIRMVYDTITPLEVAIALGVMVLFITLFATLAAKIYPRGVLKSEPMTFKQLLHLGK